MMEYEGWRVDEIEKHNNMMIKLLQNLSNYPLTQKF